MFAFVSIAPSRASSDSDRKGSCFVVGEGQRCDTVDL